MLDSFAITLLDLERTLCHNARILRANALLVIRADNMRTYELKDSMLAQILITCMRILYIDVTKNLCETHIHVSDYTHNVSNS